MSGKRALAVIGDVHDINCWSNIPFYFFRAGQRAGFFDDGLSLDMTKVKLRRNVWNAMAPLRGEGFGGYQYTRGANEAIARQISWEGIDEVVSHAQTFPSFELMTKLGISFSHYIDFPLLNLFRDYGIAETIGARTARNALAREKEQYAAAKYVVCMSPWAVRQVIQHCGTPPEKVVAIIPGANLPEELFNKEDPVPQFQPPDGRGVPLKIAFVGKLPMRKGLDRLVEGIRILRSRGLRTIVRVIGPAENLFPHDPDIEHLGFINKHLEPERLVRELRDCHLGALPSYQEAFGIAALEYLRCGLPALITRTGGLADSLPAECRILLEQDCTGLDIADALEYLLRNPDVYSMLRSNAHSMADFASWNRCIQDFRILWASNAPS